MIITDPTDKPNNIVGKNLLYLRKNIGYSQEELAADLQLHDLDISNLTIHRIETLQRHVYDYELLAFSKYFQIPADVLLTKHLGNQ